jgi:DNA-binding beta-propeller fold protein YncE
MIEMTKFSGETIWVNPNLIQMIEANPDTRILLTTGLVSLGLAGELAILDAADGRVLARVLVGRLPDGIALDERGEFAFVAVTGSNWIAVVDVGERRLAGQLPAAAGPSGVTWSSD